MRHFVYNLITPRKILSYAHFKIQNSYYFTKIQLATYPMYSIIIITITTFVYKFYPKMCKISYVEVHSRLAVFVLLEDCNFPFRKTYIFLPTLNR